MSEYLLIDLDNFYKIYSIDDIKDEYFNYTFLPNYTSIDIDILYDIYNCLDISQLNNFLIFFYKGWSKLKENKDIIISPSAKRRKLILSKTISPNKINSKSEFNDKIKEFINDDQILGLFFINKIILFLYPHIL